MQIDITLKGNDTLLSHAYQHAVQGLLYALLRGEDGYSDALHRAADNGERLFRGFTFGTLRGRFEPYDRHTIRYPDTVALEVRAYSAETILRLRDALLRRGEVRLGSATLTVDRLALTDRHITTDRARIRMLSPATVRVTDEAGKSSCLRPDNIRFYTAIRENAGRKYATLTGRAPEKGLMIMPEFSGLPKRMFTCFKGTYIEAWYGEYLLQGEPALLDALYQTGLGARNSQGFGMFALIG